MTKPFKYLSPLIVYVFSYIAFTHTGILSWSALLYAWIFIPLVELFMQPNEKNMAAEEEAIAKNNKLYDYILYLIVLLQFPTMFFYLQSMKEVELSNIDIAARIFTMGLLCGTFGINVGHELGHRKNKFEQILAKASLLSSLYMHFFIEHNKGHHKHVATPHDPSTAKYNQSVYAFWPQTLIGTYLSAWKIANEEMEKKGKPWWSLQNEMLLFQIIQISFVLVILNFFGVKIAILFMVAALIGGLLLESVNYIEHYGLSRTQTSEQQFERVQPHHSWNSSHVLGRILLFELSRHSDHHYMASRKYQVLQHHINAPQLPTGYPGSIILSLFPPAWFYIMNKKIKTIKKQAE